MIANQSAQRARKSDISIDSSNPIIDDIENRYFFGKWSFQAKYRFTDFLVRIRKQWWRESFFFREFSLNFSKEYENNQEERLPYCLFIWLAKITLSIEFRCRIKSRTIAIPGQIHSSYCNPSLSSHPCATDKIQRRLCGCARKRNNSLKRESNHRFVRRVFYFSLLDS